jgi:uncharacterized protein YecT (DUF1311 family)
MTDQIEALERLARLHQSGALTDAEFAAQKAQLLGGGASPAPRSYTPPPPQDSDGIQPLWLLLGALLAVGLGVLLWWTMVDGKGEVKPVPTPGTSASASASASPSATPSATPTPSASATTAGVAKRPTYNPSFSCSGQTDNVLAMICQSRELSNKDRELSERFKAVLRSLDETDKQTLLRRQREFLRERNSCQDTECLHSWYDRVTEFYWN